MTYEQWCDLSLDEVLNLDVREIPLKLIKNIEEDNPFTLYIHYEMSRVEIIYSISYSNKISFLNGYLSKYISHDNILHNYKNEPYGYKFHVKLVKDLIHLTTENVSIIRGVGEKSLEELEALLGTHGLELNSSFQEIYLLNEGALSDYIKNKIKRHTKKLKYHEKRKISFVKTVDSHIQKIKEKINVLQKRIK